MNPTAPASSWAVKLAGLPPELRNKTIWCLWRYEEREGKLTKVPYYTTSPTTVERARSNDPTTWTTFELACAAADTDPNFSVGLFCDGTFTFIDLDHCRDAELGLIEPWAESIVARLGGYAELSPSKTGLHIFVDGAVSAAVKKNGVEMYSTGRFATVTGDHIGGTFAPCSELEALRAALDAGAVGKKAKSFIVTAPVTLEQLERGQSPSGDQSEDDYQYVALLAERGLTDTDIDARFRASGRMREKWDRNAGHGVTYGRLTIAKVRRKQAEAKATPAEAEPVPAFVDLHAELPSQEIIPPFPRATMYGRASEWAESLDCPLGYSYLAVLTAGAGRYSIASNGTRGTLYAALMGHVGHGKSVTQDRAEKLFGATEWAIRKTPASDKGLQRLFPTQLKDDSKFVVVRGAEPRLLLIDELREMMAKAAIENSTLASMLCTLWSRDRAGNIAKDGPSHDVEAHLSILGALKVMRPSEFPQVFSFATSQGLYDRFLFAVRDVDDHWYYRDKVVMPVAAEFVPSTPTISPECDLALRDWRGGREERARLGELAKRVALISAALNGDAEILPTSASFRQALALMEYQEAIRVVYQPAQGQDPYQECVEAILAAFKHAKGAACWRDLSRRHSWHRRFPKVLSVVKGMLERNGDLCLDKSTGKHYLTSRV